jgi:hypothetical protein
MQDNMDKAAPYSFATSDPRQAMHSKDARPDAHKQAKATGTAIVPVGPVFDASSQATQSMIRQHKFGTIFLAGLMGFAIGAALGR